MMHGFLNLNCLWTNKRFGLVMQGRGGQPAGGTTSDEFFKHIKKIDAKADRDWARLPNKSEWHGSSRLVYSFDNPKIHEAALPKIEELGLERQSLPTYSPDMHKVIEHVHGWIGAEFKKRLLQDATINTPVKYAKLLEEIFFNITAAQIAKDVASLPATYQEIIRLLGDWPAKKFR